MKKIVWLLLLFISYSGLSIAQSSSANSIKLEAYKRIDNPARNEVSGIVKSTQFKNTYWVHGDSGTKDHIYAINADGEIKAKDKDFKGTEIIGAKNRDWEDIAIGNDGTLVLADFGNNCHCREDLKILIIKEPEPDDKKAEVISEYDITYPKNTSLLGLFIEDNHNAEAVFVRDEFIYVITKNETGGEAKLYRLDNPSPDTINVLTELETFKFKGQVTGADISEDESQLAVLTYHSIWLFDLQEGESMFDGKSYHQRIRGVEQVESITFSGASLIVAEENGDLYEIDIKDILEYRNN